VKNGPKIIPISGGFLADFINSAWQILAGFHNRSGRFEKNPLATLGLGRGAPSDAVVGQLQLELSKFKIFKR
jgi:hypothetical protein